MTKEHTTIFEKLRKKLKASFDNVFNEIGTLDNRIAALEEAAAKTSAQYTTDDNEDIKRALMDAHNALETAISFFRTKAEENKR